MRLIITNNNIVSGNTRDFKVNIPVLPEDKNTEYKVFISQLIIESSTDIARNYYTLVSDNIYKLSTDYTNESNNILCIAPLDNIVFQYKNHTPIEDFKISKLSETLHFRIQADTPIAVDDFKFIIVMHLEEC